MDELEEYQPRFRRRKKQTVFTAAPLLICVVALGVVYLLTGCLGLKKGTANRPTETDPAAAEPAQEQLESQSALSPEISTDETKESEAPSEEATEENTEENTEEVTEEPTEAPTEPEKLSYTTVGEGYFDDALFIGDSRTNGLELYDPPSYGADFYCGTSMTIFGVLDSTESVHGVSGLKNVLSVKQYGKIYLMFGINECGYDTGAFVDAYREVVDTVRSYQPDALIYIQSILYVTQAKEIEMSVFSSSNLKEKNAELAKLADDRTVFYLEVNDALNDGTDHLPADYTGDGVHLKASNYKYWKEYLYEHAIVDAKHPAQAEAVEPVDD